MSLLDHPISHPSLCISPIWISVITANIDKLQLRPVKIAWELFFLVLVPHGEFHLSSDDFYLVNSLVQGLIRVEFLILVF
jgi:hypothetical protein